MIKSVFSFSFMLNYPSLFLNLEKKFVSQETLCQTQISNIRRQITDSRKYLNNYKYNIDKSIKTLENVNLSESIKPNVWSDIYIKLESLQKQCRNFFKRLNAQYTIVENIHLNSIWTFQGESPSQRSRPHHISDNVLCDSPSKQYNIKDYPMPSASRYMFSRRSFSLLFFIALLLGIISLFTAISLTFFGSSIISFLWVHFNVNQATVSTVFKVLRISSYAILSLLALMIILPIIIVIYQEIQKFVSNRKKEVKVSQMKNKSIKIIFIIIGIAFLAVSIWNQQLLSFMASIFGVNNISTIPQTIITFVSLIIALFFILWSLYHSASIKSIFTSKDIEKEFENHKVSVLEQLDSLNHIIENYRSELTTANEQNSLAIHEVEKDTNERIKALESNLLEKIHLFENNQMEGIYQCKLEFSKRLEQMQYELDNFSARMDKIDGFIKRLLEN